MKGFNTHRHESNPKEKELHDKFITDFVEPKYSKNTIDRLVFGHGKDNYPNDHLTDREKEITLSTVQWLGSPVGQNFLRDCGFELKE